MLLAEEAVRLRKAVQLLATAVLAYGCYLLVAIVIHGWLRGLADETAPGRVYTIPSVTQFISGEPLAMRLQTILGADNPWFARPAFALWFSLFLLTPLLALYALVVGGLRSFLRLLAVHAVVVFTADIIFVLFPTRPPWMEHEVTRMIALRAGNITALDTNPYASLPSLHVAVPVAYAVWFWRQPDRRLNALGPGLTVWAAGIAWAVIYTGEHYVLCVAAGALLAFAVNLWLAHVHFRDIYPWMALRARQLEREPAGSSGALSPAYAIEANGQNV
jgi:hypothetical protein